MNVTVGRNTDGWEVSVCKVDLTAKGKELFEKDSLVSGHFIRGQGKTDILGQRIQQMHLDIVYEYPAGVEALGSSPTCSVQGMYARGRLITVQGHPEFNQQIVSEILASRHERGIFDDAKFEDGMARVGKEHDGVTVGKAFLRFLLDD